MIPALLLSTYPVINTFFGLLRPCLIFTTSVMYNGAYVTRTFEDHQMRIKEFSPPQAVGMDQSNIRPLQQLFSIVF
jgi:hypothetical protein